MQGHAPCAGVERHDRGRGSDRARCSSAACGSTIGKGRAHRHRQARARRRRSRRRRRASRHHDQRRRSRRGSPRRPTGTRCTVPAGWTSVPATDPWDGKTGPSHEDPEADQWSSPGSASSWALAAATRASLASYAKRRSRFNSLRMAIRARRSRPRRTVTIGAIPACSSPGIAASSSTSAYAVHDGVGYQFGFATPPSTPPPTRTIGRPSSSSSSPSVADALN